MKSVRWMAQNTVAANLLMLVLLFGGFLASRALKVEVFPEYELDRVLVTVAYPGASPEEVESSLILPIEEAVSGLDQIKRIDAVANEGSASVAIEIIEAADTDAAVQDIKAAVDRIVTFPQEAERAVVRKVVAKREVANLVVHGRLHQRVLRQHAERIRDALLSRREITQVDISGVPPPEISIEISEETLRRYGLTLSQVARIIRAASVDLPGGGVKTPGGEVLLYTKERRYRAHEYDDVVVVSRPDGSLVRLGDLATLRDTFAETDQAAIFDSDPAVVVNVYRVGDESPLEIATIIRQFIEDEQARLPAGIKLSIAQDRSLMLKGRLNLLLKNMGLGLILVVLVLGAFLEPRLAFWVTMGIPISVIGALLLMPYLGVSINMVTLFAFILVLGIVVDDAIVVGENAHAHRIMGKRPTQAAADGAIEVGRPVIFSVLTTMAAFGPLMFVSGILGKLMVSIPIIVISVLFMSLVESLYVLPAHLSHQVSADTSGSALARMRRSINRNLTTFISGPYTRLLKLVINHRYATLCFGLASLAVTLGLLFGGHVKQTFLPVVEGDYATANLSMPFGTPVDITRRHVTHLEDLALETAEEMRKEIAGEQQEGKWSVLRGIFGLTGEQVRGSGPSSGTISSSGGHLGSVRVYFNDPSDVNLSTAEFARRWASRVGEIPGAEALEFRAQIAHMGSPIGIQLAHGDFGALRQATERIKQALRNYAGVYDIADTDVEGKAQLELKLRPEARSLGITERDLADQVRSAFYGAEALRLQRDRNEVKVMVRYPLRSRRSLADTYAMRVRAQDGSEVPLSQAAYIKQGHAYSRIERIDRKRTITITANADPTVANPAEIIEEMWRSLLPRLASDYPGLTYERSGEQRERMESLSSLKVGFLAALGLIYALLAIPFRSYSQPMLIMLAVPFGMIGAVIGHVLLGYSLSIMSLLGLVALTGVVVNDSLVLVDFVNRNVRKDGKPVMDAVVSGCQRRFRPILLTTLTTFFALLPMLAETSVQARFLIPMAISLAFGVLFATGITLLLIPALYVVLEDIHALVRRTAVRWGIIAAPVASEPA